MERSKQPLCPDTKLRRLEAALAVENWHSLSEVIEKCRAGVFQWHDRPEGVCITHLVRRADGTLTCLIVAYGGTMAGAFDMVSTVEGFARANGCNTLHWSGRRGWDKVYQKLSPGYKARATIYEKEL